MMLSVAEMYDKMKAVLSKVVPDAELWHKAELAVEVNRLKVERNAVILGHNYMEPALYMSVPDYVGDSLELSRKAAETDKDIIIFCGVRFMAESAKILSPGKTVLLPSAKGGCSLAEGITAEDVRGLRARFPGVPIVTYINTYADVKAECDICCTSGNARRVVQSLCDQQIIFLPDEFLARNTARETGRSITILSEIPDTDTSVDGQIIGWKSRCEVHEQFTVQDIINARAQFPGIVILTHPECPPDVAQASDYSDSTSAMVRFVKESKATQFLLLTECSMADNIAAENPDKEMIGLCSIRCPHMNEVTLEEVRDSLLYTQHVIEVPDDVRLRATRSLARMLEI